MDDMATVFDWLTSHYPNAKRQTLREMVEHGRVMVNGEPARSVKRPIGPEDQVKVLPRPQRPIASIEPLRIIHEDPDILVVFKPAGLLTSTTAREWRQTAIGLIRAYLADREPAARPGVIHRLDRDAAGILVFSKNDEAYRHLKHQFFEHSVERFYTAIAQGRVKPAKGRIDSHLVELPDGSMRNAGDPRKGQRAITEYETIVSNGEFSLLKVRLQTGRKHQIRAHLSQRGAPIVGDTVYGKDKKTKLPLMLAATTLVLTHPRTGERLKFDAPPPEEMRALVSAVRGG